MNTTLNATQTDVPLDIATFKARSQATWMAGDFGRVARILEPSAAQFMARVPLQRGQRVLDVGCGTGNLAVIAARLGCDVTGLDSAPNLLAQARDRANGEGLTIRYDEGDAEALPYADASFDLVVSMFGVMFAPRPERATAELLRVCRPGGVIALANWTPEGLIGDMFKVTRSHVAPPVGVPSPLIWGRETAVRTRLGRGIAQFRCTRRLAHLRFPFPVPGTVEFFRQHYGPTLRAFDALDRSGQAALRSDLEALFEGHNLSGPETTQVLAEYLEIVAVRLSRANLRASVAVPDRPDAQPQPELVVAL
jgi:SAM-dependent methyltransferase